MTNMTKLEWIKNQNLGVEIELVGATRQKAALAVQSVVGGTVEHVGIPTCYDPWLVKSADGRQWAIKCDNSLTEVSADLRVEVISPILRYDDLLTLQEVIRALRAAGLRASSASGLHCHLDGSNHTPQTIKNLIKTFNRLEHLIYKAVGVQEARLQKYCKPNEAEFVEKISNMRSISLKSLNKAWYGRFEDNPQRMNHTRYHAINLNNLFATNGSGYTIEFRFGEVWPRIHAGKIKAFIILCLALSAHALCCTGVTPRRKQDDGNQKYSLRVALNGMGLATPEFRNVRKHLLANLPGNSAWKDPSKAKNNGKSEQSKGEN